MCTVKQPDNALLSVVWRDTTTLSKNQSTAQMSLCKCSSPTFSGDNTTEHGGWRELASRLRKSKTRAGVCISETWGSSRGGAVEFLQKWQIGWRKKKSFWIQGAAEGRHHWRKNGGQKQFRFWVLHFTLKVDHVAVGIIFVAKEEGIQWQRDKTRNVFHFRTFGSFVKYWERSKRGHAECQLLSSYPSFIWADQRELEFPPIIFWLSGIIACE